MKTPMHVPSEFVRAVDDMRGLLLQHYGCDFSFTIMARGRLVAACNLVDGDIRPVAESGEEYADRREAEIERANPLD